MPEHLPPLGNDRVFEIIVDGWGMGTNLYPRAYISMMVSVLSRVWVWSASYDLSKVVEEHLPQFLLSLCQYIATV